MFGMFPLGRGNIISFTSFTSFTSTGNGINGFNVTNSYNGFYDPDQLNYYNPNNNLNEVNLFGEIQDAVNSVLSNVNIQELAEQYYNTISDIIGENSIEEKKTDNDCDFIRLERDEAMYILQIDMKGIDLRELSIRYDPGILDINLKRSEYDDNFYNYMGQNNNFVKKKYSTSFNNIEEIDTDKVLKSFDNGILVMRMPKKYVIDSSSKIVEVENYTVDEESSKVIPKV